MARRGRETRIAIRQTGRSRKIRSRRGFSLFRSPANLLHRVQSATGMSRRTQVTAQMVPGGADLGGASMVRSWDANGQSFFMTSDGKIHTRKKNGVMKSWRPPRHIVVSRNPRVGTLLRATKRMGTLLSGLQKSMPRKTTRRKSSTPSSHSHEVISGK